MEFTHIEPSLIKAVSCDAQETEIVELKNLQLAFVGGGNVIITFG